jgi:thimet oligopeptidase
MISGKVMIAIAFFAIAIIFYFFISQANPLGVVKSIADVQHLFPTTPDQIESRMHKGMKEVEQIITQIVKIPRDKRTYQNTAYPFDQLDVSDLAIFKSIINTTEMVNPDKKMRDAAHEAGIKIESFFVDWITDNVELYLALKAYIDGNAKNEELTDQQQRFLQEKIKDFEREGLKQSKEVQEVIKKLKKEISQLGLEFEANIAQDKTTVIVSRDDLKGMDEDFINARDKTPEGSIILTLDYPIYYPIMEFCSVAATRKKMGQAFNNRALANKDILQKVIAKRDELAKLLGFPDGFASYVISNQMAESVSRVDAFINQMINKSKNKADEEFALITKDLPAGVELVEGKVHPWDMIYLRNYYKENHYKIDERKISEYFAMEKTIKGLLDIYQKFFSLTFKQSPIKVWHEEVMLIEVYDKQQNMLGYLLLDLYPRPDKFSHACEITIVPATYYADGTPNRSVCVVLANFPKSTALKPSLLQRSDVKTFFHEFGHALHSILGRTHVANFSGTNVKTDFVEMPSQMLENWLIDKEILTMLSSHYQTGASLPADLIDKIIAVKNFGAGNFIQTQMLYAKLALEYFKTGEFKDVDALLAQLSTQIKRHTIFDPQDHMYASFGHLMGYNAKYYGYMWSQVFAADLFDTIKKHGLLNPEIGTRYVNQVIGKGGSQDPNQLLRDFLGREPNQDAFLKDMGLL